MLASPVTPTAVSLEQYPVHYMSKPVTMEQLVGRVKELLAAA